MYNGLTDVAPSLPDDIYATYCPVLHLHHNDAFRPVSIDWFIERSQLNYYPCGVTGAAELHELDRIPGGIVRLIPSGEVTQENILEAQATCPHPGNLSLTIGPEHYGGVSCDQLGEVPIYAHAKLVVDDSGAPEAYEINYITFYAFNGHYQLPANLPIFRSGHHVGDWEHLTVRLGATSLELQGVWYNAHRNIEGEWCPAADVPRTPCGRILGYVAINGHGIYPHCGTIHRLFFMANDRTSRSGPVWSPARLVRLAGLAHGSGCPVVRTRGCSLPAAPPRPNCSPPLSPPANSAHAAAPSAAAAAAKIPAGNNTDQPSQAAAAPRDSSCAGHLASGSCPHQAQQAEGAGTTTVQPVPDAEVVSAGQQVIANGGTNCAAARPVAGLAGAGAAAASTGGGAAGVQRPEDEACGASCCEETEGARTERPFVAAVSVGAQNSQDAPQATVGASQPQDPLTEPHSASPPAAVEVATVAPAAGFAATSTPIQGPGAAPLSSRTATDAGVGAGTPRSDGHTGAQEASDTPQGCLGCLGAAGDPELVGGEVRASGRGFPLPVVVHDTSPWQRYQGFWGSVVSATQQGWFLGPEPPVSRGRLRRLFLPLARGVKRLEPPGAGLRRSSAGSAFRRLLERAR